MDKLADSITNTAALPNSTDLTASQSFITIMLDAKKYGEMILSDLHWASWQIFIFLVAAGVISFLWILIMRWFSGPMIWLSILLGVLAIAAGTAASWYQYWVLTSTDTGENFRITLRYKSYLQMTKLWMALGIIGAIFFTILVLLLLFLRSRIVIAIQLIKEASKAVGSMMSTLIFPLFPCILQLMIIALWATVAVHLASWGQPNCRNFQTINTAETQIGVPATSNPAEIASIVNGSKCDCDKIGKDQPHCTFVNYTEPFPNFVFAAQSFNLFGLFWSLFFCSALCDIVLAGAFASWYWAFRKPDDIPATPLLLSLTRALRYHLGTLAFGSLILAIIRFVRVILEYIDEKLKNAQNPIAEFAMKCLKCCLWCLEKCVRFLNRNAYIITAVYGKAFCPAAKEAFSLLMRNAVRVWVLDKIANFLLFLGKFFITVGMGALAYLYFSGYWGWNAFLVEQLNYSAVPMLLVIGATYLIADEFFDVYEMAVDTTFLCFLEDSERNDGSPEKPYFMSKRLMKILNKKNAFAAVKKKESED